MSTVQADMDATLSVALGDRDLVAFQAQALQGVSRTFALTIPELPDALEHVVGNAYLWCRIADTIEDEAGLSADEKQTFHDELIQVVAGQADGASFAERLLPQLTRSASQAERHLVRDLPTVMAILQRFNAHQQAAIRRCLQVMCDGMPRFESRASLAGLPDQADLDLYCYYVAGVVGQMLTELFCDYSPRMQARREDMLRLSVSFGQGLQMTNILKDIWDDHARGVCWLPAGVFERAGFDLADLKPGCGHPAFAAGLRQLIAVAHGHLRNALEYSLLIPAQETGIRRFCLWAIGLAVLSLRKLDDNPAFVCAQDVKVSRNALRATIYATNRNVSSDKRLRQLFQLTAESLPVLSPALPAPVDGIALPDMPATSPFKGDTMSARSNTVALTRRQPDMDRRQLEVAIEHARNALVAEQNADGHWCYELEADCSIPAEYILMMHFVDDIDTELQVKLAAYLRNRQEANGGWPLYYGSDFDMSCSVKAYYALKLAGDDPQAEHMQRARKAILARGGAARANAFTVIALAQFGQIPWRAVPFIPVEAMLLPRQAPFHLSKVSYWARTVMVPLFILCSLRVTAKNPNGVNVRELFTVAPEKEKDFLPADSRMGHVFKWLDKVGRTLDPLIPGFARKRAIAAAERWIIQRLNGEGGLGAIFPAMINAYEALGALGYAADHPYRLQTRKAIDDLLVIRDHEAYCQPCVSPVWDTALSCHALQQADRAGDSDVVLKGLDWLKPLQQLEGAADWQDQHPDLPGGGWAFQYENDHYPDLDDTSVIAWAMHNAGDTKRYGHAIDRAAQWLRGMQSANGGFAAFDSDNDHDYLNEIPFADHDALLDPPTSDVTARVVAFLSQRNNVADAEAIHRAMEFLRNEQEADGSWFGRWGTNYVYGTWSVLSALEAAGEDMQQPWIRRAVTWLEGMQRADGGWGEDNGNYWQPARGNPNLSTSFQTAWAVLGLLAAGEVDNPAVERGVAYLLEYQNEDAFWDDPYYTAPGFPRVFYLNYYGYKRFFPLWALARYRNLTE